MALSYLVSRCLHLAAEFGGDSINWLTQSSGDVLFFAGIHWRQIHLQGDFVHGGQAYFQTGKLSLTVNGAIGSALEFGHGIVAATATRSAFEPKAAWRPNQLWSHRSRKEPRKLSRRHLLVCVGYRNAVHLLSARVIFAVGATELDCHYAFG